tara:strand:+ start:325 stop:528 length:204 start_codon:yes stop_codon:yes gene_type:complete
VSSERERERGGEREEEGGGECVSVSIYEKQAGKTAGKTAGENSRRKQQEKTAREEQWGERESVRRRV